VAPGLSYELHKLTARLDRAADGLLRQEERTSYSRFLTLFAEGLLEVGRVDGGGNRRRLRLTTGGTRLVERSGHLLEGRFDELVGRSGVPYDSYQGHTRSLLDHLDLVDGEFGRVWGTA
jgi:hypothetical protein